MIELIGVLPEVNDFNDIIGDITGYLAVPLLICFTCFSFLGIYTLGFVFISLARSANLSVQRVC
jgi:hypothetical protein